MVVYSRFFNKTYTLEQALTLSAPDVSLSTISGGSKTDQPAKIIKLFQRFVDSAKGNDNPYRVQEEARNYVEGAVSMIETIHER